MSRMVVVALKSPEPFSRFRCSKWQKCYKRFCPVLFYQKRRNFAIFSTESCSASSTGPKSMTVHLEIMFHACVEKLTVLWHSRVLLAS
jgi:hypothetical protein